MAVGEGSHLSGGCVSSGNSHNLSGPPFPMCRTRFQLTQSTGFVIKSGVIVYKTYPEETLH